MEFYLSIDKEDISENMELELINGGIHQNFFITADEALNYHKTHEDEILILVKIIKQDILNILNGSDYIRLRVLGFLSLDSID